MNQRYERVSLVMGAVLMLTMALLLVPRPSLAQEAASIKHDAVEALQHLYNTTPAAKALGEKAAGVLVFPSVGKGGLIVGGHYGKGALFQKSNPTQYYKTTAVSVGLQLGGQKFAYALIFMTNKDLAYLKSSEGWEVGTNPNVVLIDKGAASALSTTTAKKGVYAFFFDQKGLMAGLGLQGTKITRIYPEN